MLGIAMRLLAVLLLATLSALIKLAEARGAGLVEIMFWRQGAAIPVVLAYMAITDRGLGAVRSNAFRGQVDPRRDRRHRDGVQFRRGAVAAARRGDDARLHRADLRDDPGRAGAQGADRLASLGRGRDRVRRRADRDAAGQRARSADRRAGRADVVGVRRDRRDPAAPDRQGRPPGDHGVLVLDAVDDPARPALSVLRATATTPARSRSWRRWGCSAGWGRSPSPPRSNMRRSPR